MKNNFIRLCALFALILCLCLALAACGGNKDEGTPTPVICQHRDANDDSKCDKCGQSYTDGTDIPSVPPHSHVASSEFITNLTGPTCTAPQSYDSVTYCTVPGCGIEMSRSTVILAPATGHRYSDSDYRIENEIAATCSSSGSYDVVWYCTADGCREEMDRRTVTTPQLDHADDNRDTKCDSCGSTVREKPYEPGTTETGGTLPDVTWTTTTTLNIQMTDGSNNGELSSGCRRYLSGESDGMSAVEIAVRERNARAMNYANVDVAYAYYISGDLLGSTITSMWNAATSDTAAGRPDIFCNYVYDMVSASLLKAFKNLYNDSYVSDGVMAGNNLNYFSFAKDGHYDTIYVDTGDGYMIEYMQSLTLQEEKMYLLASDYFTDLVRAFFVVPVNAAIMEGGIIAASTDPCDFNYDYNDNGMYDMVDFYELVIDGRWTYDAVKYFSNAVYVEGDPNNILDPNGSGRYGFVVAAGELSAAGLMYTTSVTIIERSVELVESIDPDNPGMIQQYAYRYPEEAQPLVAFATALSNLFTSDGVACLEIGVNSTASTTAELEVRRAFAANQVLFGGIVCVGSLEDYAYGDMSANGGKGFGVVPVPLFRTSHEVEKEDGTMDTVRDTYKTAIHNIGKVGAIAVKSEKFAQCSAFLNYQSLNSSSILDDYYNLTLKTDAPGAVEGNAEMLDYIRSNVRSDFDKVYEDAIARHGYIGGGSTMNANKWHNIILSYSYVLPAGAMQEKYDSLVDMKDTYLQQLAQSYTNLPE